MSRRALFLFACLTCNACLDDDLDPNTHYLRAALEPTTDDDETGSTGTPGTATMTPGKTVVLGELDSFIALDRNFEDFQSWTSFDLGEGEHVVEQSGHKMIYINALPQAGDREFRVGTMIVKVLELGEDLKAWQVHAMVKRGAGYNANGAFGWEYFDFTLDDDGIPRQNWRGETAPDGESYQVSVFTSDGVILQDVPDCNTCHQSASNDGINTAVLDLDRWQ